MSAYEKNWMRKKIESAKYYQDIAYHEVNELVFKKREGRVITLVDDRQLIDFVSCSYLGLDLDPRVIEAGTNNIRQCGVTFPAARTRIKAQSFVELEKLLNEIFCHSHSIIFSSLHLGHLGILPLLGSGELPSFPLQKNGAIFILDKTVHASIQINRGLMEQFGTVILVNFQDKSAVEQEFAQASANKLTPIGIADSIGSMGGITPIIWLFQMAEKYNGYLYLDDAHGTSIHGKHGCGYVLHMLKNSFHPRLILAASLAKGFGAVAGVIALPSMSDVEMMKEFSQTYVFGGPPPLSIIDSAIAAAKIHLTNEINFLQSKLWENVNYFDSLIENKVVNKNHLSPIRGIKIGDELAAIKCTAALREQGFAVTTAMYPTVAKEHSILRVALSAAHEKKQIHDLCVAVKKLMTVSDK